MTAGLSTPVWGLDRSPKASASSITAFSASFGGASQYARDTLRRWHARGLVGFTLRDEEYFNPWLASRWLVFWLGLSIGEARGDLDLAVRAYNVGISRAIAGDGEAYLEGVERRRQRYVVAVRADFTVASSRTAPAQRADALLAGLPLSTWQTVRWRQGSKGWLRGRFAAVRCWRVGCSPRPSPESASGRPPADCWAR